MARTPFFGKIVLVTAYQNDTLEFLIQQTRQIKTVTWGDRNQIIDFDPTEIEAVVGSLGLAYLNRDWLIANNVPYSAGGDPKIPPGLPGGYPDTIVLAEVLEVTPIVLMTFDGAGAAEAGAIRGRLGPIALPAGPHLTPDPASPVPTTFGDQFLAARIEDRWLRERGLVTRARGRKKRLSGMVVGLDVKLGIQSGPFTGEEVVVNPYDHEIVGPSPSVDPNSHTKIELGTLGARGDVALAGSFLNS